MEKSFGRSKICSCLIWMLRAQTSSCLFCWSRQRLWTAHKGSPKGSTWAAITVEDRIVAGSWLQVVCTPTPLLHKTVPQDLQEEPKGHSLFCMLLGSRYSCLEHIVDMLRVPELFFWLAAATVRQALAFRAAAYRIHVIWVYRKMLKDRHVGAESSL